DSIVHLTLTVNALPIVAILGDTIIEPGSYTMLVATFGVGYTYLWSNGGQGNMINVSPMEDTYYSVTVTNSDGCSASDSVLVTLIDTTGIRDHKLETMVLIYPNPAVRNVTISAQNEEIREVEFYNMLGALVKKESVRQTEAVIEISELTKGNYLLRIIFQNGHIMREKLIVQ
ncbi:MAG TPA: T9SS type A sorting domain-containing protein, partial [Bacteroidales bacterium]|nr:T9SS type A sorting domain-containing protein [Bacteroidales bacterium]